MSVTAVNVEGREEHTGIRAVLEVVVGADLDDVGEEVAARKHEVLDDNVERVVGVLDARDGHVANLVDNVGKDGVTDVGPELRLEGETALGVEEKVLGEARPVLAEADKGSVRK